jgi:hypothetical protein
MCYPYCVNRGGACVAKWREVLVGSVVVCVCWSRRVKKKETTASYLLYLAQTNPLCVCVCVVCRRLVTTNHGLASHLKRADVEISLGPWDCWEMNEISFIMWPRVVSSIWSGNFVPCMLRRSSNFL